MLPSITATNPLSRAKRGGSIARALDTGELIEVHEHGPQIFEAVADVWDLPGGPDRHSLGGTPEEAVCGSGIAEGKITPHPPGSGLPGTAL